MSDEAAFLRALEANPADDTARLVYADWLDERNDPRGEYLRAFVLTRRESPRCRKPEVVAAMRQMRLLALKHREIITWMGRVGRYAWIMPDRAKEFFAYFRSEYRHPHFRYRNGYVWVPNAVELAEAVSDTAVEAWVTRTELSVVAATHAELATVHERVQATQLALDGGEFQLNMNVQVSLAVLANLLAHIERAVPYLPPSASAGPAFTALSPNSASSVSEVNVSLQSSE